MWNQSLKRNDFGKQN
jgi:hypothetical protein